MDIDMINKYIILFIWGMLPVYLIGLILIGMEIIKHTKQDKLSILEEICDKKKDRKIETNNSDMKVFNILYYFTWITLIVISLLAVINEKYHAYIEKMLGKMDVISSTVVGLTGIAITMSIAIVLFDRRYYLVFSIHEILKKYGFSLALKVVVICCIIVTVTTMTLLDAQLESAFDWIRFMVLEICTIYNIGGATYILYVIMDIMFIGQKKELRLLDTLYKVFLMDQIDTSNFKKKKKWSKDAVKINVDYLTNRYLGICQSKKLERIIAVEFVSTRDCYSQKWYEKARTKFSRMLAGCMVISGCTVISEFVKVYHGKMYSTLAIVLGLILMLNIIALVIGRIKCKKGKKFFQLVILRLYSDSCGYYLYTADKRHEQFVPRVAMRRSNCYDKYIKRMNSIIAFFFIWITYVDKKENVKKCVFEEMIEDLDKLHTKNMAIYLPAFTIGFLLYEQGIYVDNMKVLYNKMIVKEKKQYLFQRMVDSQIFYMTKNFNEDSFEYRRMLNQYFEWIAG